MAPTVSFQTYTSELTVDFELMASDVDGTIVEVEWNFGDETTSSEVSPSHTFGEGGIYLVSSTVTDDDGVDLAEYIFDSGGLGLEEFAVNFGKINCP